MTLDTHIPEAAATAARPRFVGPGDDVSEPPARAHSRLPPWLFRLLLAWGALTIASIVGPCRPLSPSPALAAEASP